LYHRRLIKANTPKIREKFVREERQVKYHEVLGPKAFIPLTSTPYSRLRSVLHSYCTVQEHVHIGLYERRGFLCSKSLRRPFRFAASPRPALHVSALRRVFCLSLCHNQLFSDVMGALTFGDLYSGLIAKSLHTARVWIIIYPIPPFPFGVISDLLR
jgi:hypothetical protein